MGIKRKSVKCGKETQNPQSQYSGFQEEKKNNNEHVYLPKKSTI